MTENANFANGMKLLVSTKSSDPKPFWAIDKVRLCRKKEFRVTVLTEEAPCQLISESEQIAYFNRYSQFNLNSNCPEDAIGDFCVPCNWIFNECKQITICKGQTCVCSAGYQGKDCFYECDSNAYGHGCKQCGKKVNGKCLSSECLESYSRYNAAPATIFANPPEIIEISYTEAIVRISNFDLESYGPHVTPQHYIIQYKTAQASDTNWTQINNQYAQFNMSETFKITNLKSETQYLVRSVIISTNRWWHIGDHLKTNKFTTRCEDISDGDINIEASNTTARIYLSPGTPVTCKSYTIALFEQQVANFSNNSASFFTDLLPRKNYTLKVYGAQKTHEKKFSTDERVPTPVLSLMATASATTVDIKWTEPSSMNGAFRHYVVEYQHISYKSCNNTSSQSSTKSQLITNDTSITITGLIPYSLYKFTVFAVNSKFNGPPSFHTTTTLNSEKILPEEGPSILDINTTPVSANIVLSKVKCENIRGSLIVKLKTTCTSEWCQNKNSTRIVDTNIFSNITNTEIMNLEPFSEYDLELNFCRNNESCKTVQKKKFKTWTAVPRAITDLLVYTRNTSSISLRWKPPYPPTGILKDYKINYYNYQKSLKRGRVVAVTPCRLWTELHCATLSDLPFNAHLKIEMYARNANPEDYGPPIEVDTYVRTEKSKPPYDLILKWTPQNDLRIEWKHPNESNGDISYFAIQIMNSNETIAQKLNVSRDTYSVKYQHVVNSLALSATTHYKVAVYAFNGEKGDPAKETTTSPPDVPMLSKDAEFVNLNNIIKISVVPNKVRGSTSTYRLFVLRSDQQNNLELYPSLQMYDLKNLKVVVECDVSRTSETFEIYIGSIQEYPSCTDKDNFSLQPATTYNITIVLQNFFKNESRTTIYSYQVMEPGITNSSVYWVIVLLILIPVVVFFGFKWYTKNIGSFHGIHNSGTSVDRQENEIPLTDTKQSKWQNNRLSSFKNMCGNLNVYSNVIERKDFQNYTKTLLNNQELKHQHEAILETISTYERVLDRLHFEYVDMNYISGFQMKNTYVVIKIPTFDECDDFWKTIWTENICHIILFEDINLNDRTSDRPYWPNQNKQLYGDITVQCTTSEDHHLFKRRKFTITFKNKSRQIEQLHFRLDSDDRFYLSSFSYVNFFQKMTEIHHSSKSPILVHSSSGMRGVGFVLLCDISLRAAMKDGSLDVVANLKHLTQCTSEMMVDFDHYVLAHIVIADCLRHVDTGINCNDFNVAKQELFYKTEIQKHLQYLQDTDWLDRIKYEDDDEHYMYSQAIFPKSTDKIPLVPCSSEDDDSCLKRFNVVKIYGFKAPKKFLVVQEPKANPLSDFLNLVQDERVTVVVTLNENIFSWPSKNYPVMKINSDVVLEHQLTINFKTYNWITVKLTTATASQTLEVISFKNWLAPIVSLPKPEDFTNFVSESNEIFKKVELVLVTDCGNVTASGLYIATTYVIQKIKNEGICDVCSSVRMLRRYSENFVVDNSQYKFLLEVAHNYLKEFSLYEVR